MKKGDLTCCYMRIEFRTLLMLVDDLTFAIDHMNLIQNYSLLMIREEVKTLYFTISLVKEELLVD